MKVTIELRISGCAGVERHRGAAGCRKQVGPFPSDSDNSRLAEYPSEWRGEYERSADHPAIPRGSEY